MPDELANSRNERNYYDTDDHQSEVVFDDGDIAKEIARQRQATNPRHAAQRAEHNEQPVIHRADARNKRGESANDGQKAREDNGLTAMLGIEHLRLFQMLVPEETRIVLE